MKNLLPKNIDWTILASMLLGAGFLGMFFYTNYKTEALENELAKITESNTAFIENIESRMGEISELFFDTLTEEQKKNQDLIQRFEKVNDSVEELEKLTTTDPELLQKYSKVYFLNEHYVPKSLKDIDEEFRNIGATNYQIHGDVYPFLKDLLEEAKDDGLDLIVTSAYRSYDTQAALKANYTVTYGAGANKFSADQGYSEHQLGTTVDFSSRDTKGALNGFDKTPEYEWLKTHAHKYGFILSYPKDNAYYKFEPWHWRFVGEDLARRLHDDGMYFYDLDQRIIDTYLSKIFD